jgi:UDP-GlcNAc:undecaprenyl-phosphate/decaprenyl-phosphate GlcNAc-1-phosphate transferase
MNILFLIVLPIVLSLLITIVIIPCWIRVCRKWNLFERPDDRKRHRHLVPTMGGLAIYAGIIISFLILGQDILGQPLKYLMAASVILFFTGFFDDLLDLPAIRKLFLQILAATLVTYAGIRITSMYGLFGIHELNGWIQYPVTILFIVGITNAYNLVDGIDGLAGTLGLLASLIYGVIFYHFGYSDFAILSFTVSGALLGFLCYNFHPAKIFMGDTGSLIVGFMLASMAVNLLTINSIPNSNVQGISPALIMSVLFVPVYDVLRVTVIRLLTGSSPLQADRNHVHYMITSQGFGQRATTFIIVLINLVIILLAIYFKNMNINFFLLMSLCFGLIIINTMVMSRLAWLYRRAGGNVHSKTAQI